MEELKKFYMECIEHCNNDIVFYDKRISDCNKTIEAYRVRDKNVAKYIKSKSPNDMSECELEIYIYRTENYIGHDTERKIEERVYWYNRKASAKNRLAKYESKLKEVM